MRAESRRPSPEELLRVAEAEEAGALRGRLKVFLGYASGVGKSQRMLNEAVRRRERGQDIVIGAMQPVLPAEVAAIASKLETVALKETRSVDVDAILRRRPAACVIDGLAYDNPPGSRHGTRWQDVEEILEAGIAVITSINIQYVAELREQVEAITGKRVTDTVPVAFLERADEIELVDAPAEEPIERSPEHVSARQEQLSRLREIALVLAADVVDRELTAYLQSRGIEEHFGTHERILVCVTPRANVAEMLSTARMVADRFHGELICAYVRQPQLSAEDQATLDRKLEAARAAGAAIEILEGEDAIESIVDFARSRGITQIFIGHTQRSGFWTRMWGSPVDKLIRLTPGIDVRIFPQ